MRLDYEFTLWPPANFSCQQQVLNVNLNKYKVAMGPWYYDEQVKKVKVKNPENGLALSILGS